ncbi:MAG: hypothetical protein F6K38_07235 [Moorea sp. SIO3B2]|nr:hypothetical protein [Moorena sp. SIO3B2]
MKSLYIQRQKIDNKKGLRSLVGDVLENYYTCQWIKKVRYLSSFLSSNDNFQTVKQSSLQFGALVYDSCNIGDEIQTIAQITNLSKYSIDFYPCHREFLDSTPFPQKTILMMN